VTTIFSIFCYWNGGSRLPSAMMGEGEGGGNKQKCVREEGGLTNGTVGCVRRGLAVGTLLSGVFNNYYTSPSSMRVNSALHQPYKIL